MKKLLTIVILFLTMGLASQAQTKTFVQAGVATSNLRTFESLEAGATTGKNSLSVVLESYNAGNDLTFNADREYFGGIKYVRAKHVGKYLDLLISGVAKVHIDKALELSVEPGVGLGVNINKTLSLTGTMSSPLQQNTTPFKELQLKAGVGVQIRI